MECLDCVGTTARLHLYIDRELNAEEVEIVQQHLGDCPRCECRFHFDVHLKRLIHERCTIQQAPAHLRQAVMQYAHTLPGAASNIDPAIEMEIRADLESR
ncbi:MAG TPA: zf-HC2 domain-containing protein [Ktedonobacteraceae bacterium]|jgi:mycothiol system anti-sigma-R factor|nr:zf-HC2 domain-containing protein [Ktedonobacteraceae bacterium]